MTDPTPTDPDRDTRPHEQEGPNTDPIATDPTDTDHPTGDKQAAENAANESPA